MSKVSPDKTAISVHGRETLRVPYSRWSMQNGVEVQMDISQSTVYLEIPAANIRRALIANPSDPKGLLIYLPRVDVAKIPTQPTPFAVIDETAMPSVEWEGKIFRTGYVEQPNG